MLVNAVCISDCSQDEACLAKQMENPLDASHSSLNEHVATGKQKLIGCLTDASNLPSRCEVAAAVERSWLMGLRLPAAKLIQG